MAKVTKEEIKERGLRIGLNQIVTYATLVPIFWFIAQPILVKALASEMQDTIQDTVAAQVEPINDAFVALLQRDINATKKDIAALKFRQRQDDEWTVDDAEYLADLEIQLAALEEAKMALLAKTETS